MVNTTSNFEPQNFTVKKDAIEFLEKLGFKKIIERSDYDVYETEHEPKKRANLNEEKDGKYFVGQHVEKK